ncbi:helix-turn-helix domain-containing protein [Flavihumibacter rivuli]|uniref:GlxA family transcriptional regulator n=1 Tax=Flavihumibacter rivuli TaxID=2838156 RepID=UPI001BDDF2BD|nr:helix-turn-helix domain-containing protein [Flavihumibacter rivuli]ULQ56234.1 helix-turn-helix domain-containing protein [Flavihumibacter rivuli]
MHISILAIQEQSNLSTVACMAGSFEIFNEANTYWRNQGNKGNCKIELVGASKKKILKNNLFQLNQHCSINDVDKTDLIIIPASLVRNYENASNNNKLLINWIEEQYKKGAEVASMCTGIFMLASTGLLEKRSCSTHWSVSEQFNLQFPNINLQTDRLITDEKGIYTNGGAYSFLHLIIYLVEKYFDRETAVYCAKVFQIDLNRNLQAEFSIFNGHKKHTDEIVLQSQNYFEANYTDKITIEKLAKKYNIGRRNFDRRFSKATGISPLDYLQRIRIEAAKKLFENSRKTVNEVMYEVGYNDPKAFREVFNRVTGLSPLAYKSKYNKERDWHISAKG